MHDDDTESAVSHVSKSIRAGRTALLAEVAEQSAEVVDTAMRRLGGEVLKVLRRSTSDVGAEVAAAAEAQREAHKQLHEARREKHKQEIRAQLEQLKAKLHLNKKAAATTV